MMKDGKKDGKEEGRYMDVQGIIDEYRNTSDPRSGDKTKIYPEHH